MGLAGMTEAEQPAEAARLFGRLAEEYGAQAAPIVERACALWMRADLSDSAIAFLEKRWQEWHITADGEKPADDLVRHLARHGVKAEGRQITAGGISEGEALLSYASDVGADLLVCGMYGHSRFREMAFGGVTRSLLAAMTLPSFLAH